MTSKNKYYKMRAEWRVNNLESKYINFNQYYLKSND